MVAKKRVKSKKTHVAKKKSVKKKPIKRKAHKKVSSQEEELSASKISNFNVKTPNELVSAKNLSGGNLQKFVIGREISSKPKLLIVNQPTWGVDTGAESFIRESLVKLSNEGTSLLIISQDLDELIEITHSVSVISNGKLSKPFETKNLNIEKLGIMMGGEVD